MTHASPAARSCDGAAVTLPALTANGDYDCPLCGGTELRELENGSFARCTCHVIRAGLRRLRRLGLLAAAQRMTLDAFIAEEPWQQTLLERVRAFTVGEPGAWLFIGGQSGCGKTHLCTAAATSLLLAGYDLRYMRWQNDCAALKSLALEPARDALMRELLGAPLLYIDDLFKTPPTEADRRIAFEIIGGRCDDPGKITILSSERTLEEITRFDEAIGGRIFQRCLGRYQLNVSRDPARNFRFREQRQA